MKKPVYQSVLEFLIFFIPSLALLLGLVDGFANTLSLITFPLAMWTTIAVITAYVIVLALFRYRKLKWVSKSGQPLRVVQFSTRVDWTLSITLSLLWLGALYNSHAAAGAALAQNVVQRPVFNAKEKRFKVLIARFNKECDYQGLRYDIGQVMQYCLENKKITDTINLITHYLDDSTFSRNLSHEKAEALMKFHHADMILYGTYSLRQCENGTSDKICFNYQTDAKKLGLDEMHSQTEYRMYNFNGLEDIRSGTGQENIDYVIYWVTAMSAMKDKNYPAAITRLQKIKDHDKRSYILSQVGNCYFFMNDQRNAAGYLIKAVQADSTNGEAWAHLGVIAAKNRNLAGARILLDKGLSVKPGNLCVLENLGSVCLVLKDTVKAREAFREIYKLYADNDIVLVMLAEKYRKIGEYARAKELLDESLNIHSFHPETWKALGALYQEMKDTANAKMCFDKALFLNMKAAKPGYTAGVLGMASTARID